MIFITQLNPDYAIEILLRTETPAKYEASQLLLFHHRDYYVSITKVHILLAFLFS
jgi:hypothetical protein